MPPSVRQVLGIAAHEAVETNLSQKISSRADLPTEEVVEAFSTSYDHGVGEVSTPEEDPGRAKDGGIALVRAYQDRVSPAIQPVLVEAPIDFTINDIPYSGTLDLVDDARRVRDLKTKSRTPSAGDNALQLIGYALGYRRMTGETESEVVLDYMIRRTVRGTQGAEYAPVTSGGPVSDPAIRAFTETVERASAGIEAGVFLPNGLKNYSCAWCGFRPVCPAANKP